MPSAVLGMLDVLEVRDGDRVLEIGTGTGYNAAQLAHRLGDDHVATVEIDQTLAEQARTALEDSGHKPTVICNDGATGHPAGAPYDRIIVTAAVKLGRIPYVWVEQVRPGGTIVVPMKTDFAAGPLVVFTIREDGRATGRVAPMRVRFMGCARNGVRAWTGPLCGGTTPLSGSWASVIPGDTDDRYAVRQYGPRRLWDEASAAYRWWLLQGKPSLDQWRFTISRDHQSAELLV